MISGKRIFITGGAGFIGSHLAEKLVGDNEIVVYDTLHRNAAQYTDLAANDRFTLVQGDVLDAPRMREAMKGADLCVHAAAIAGIYSVGQSLTRTIRVNLLGTVNALEAAVANGVAKFIDFSTSEVYGPFVFRGRETDRVSIGPTGERRWIYAISKLAAEHFSHAMACDEDISVVCLRPFNVYGPRQIGEGAIQQMVNRALRNEDIVVYNDGTQVRSWCYIADFVDGLYAAVVCDTGQHATFNIGNPQATITVYGLAETIIRLTGSASQIVMKPHPGPEVEMRVPDVTGARDALGFQPKVGLEDGLRRTIAWYRSIAEGGARH